VGALGAAGHIGFFLNGSVTRFLDSALAATGLTGGPGELPVSPSAPGRAAAS
jgi:hypothetical protein